MLIFGLCSTSDDQPGWSMDLNPIHHPSPAKKIKCSFFGLCSTSGDQPGWSMDSNPIRYTSPAKKMKCSYLDYIQPLMIGRAGQWTRNPSTTLLQPKNEMLILDYVQLLMIGWAGQWTQTPSTTPLLPKNEMLIFGLYSTSDDWLGWLMDSNPICHPSAA